MNAKPKTKTDPVPAKTCRSCKRWACVHWKGKGYGLCTLQRVSCYGTDTCKHWLEDEKARVSSMYGMVGDH